MAHLGDREIGKTITFYFQCLDKNGAAVAPSVGPSYSVYEEENGTQIVDAATSVTNLDGLTGFYSEQLTLAAATYDAGKDYVIRISATCDSVATVMLHTFRAVPARLSLDAGIAEAGAAGSITLDADAAPSSSDDAYNGALVTIISGTGAGQTRRVTDYVGSTRVASTAPAWTTNPSTDSYYVITADAPVDVLAISGDETAANNLEAMLDGTGGVGLTLNKLTVAASSAAGAVEVTNSAGGPGVKVTGGTSGNGVELNGNGSGAGLVVTGGLTGSGATITAGANGGGYGLAVIGKGAGHGLDATGGVTGSGVYGAGGATSGFGMYLVAGGGNSPGWKVQGAGTAGGIEATGGASAGPGILATGGSDGPGLKAIGGDGAAGGDGAQFLASANTGDKAGLVATGHGAGQGLKATGGATGHGAELVGGATSGDGLRATAAGGIGAHALAGGNNPGFKAIGGNGGAAGHGLLAVSGTGGGHAVRAQAATSTATGHGVYASGSGTAGGQGFRCESGAAGAGFYAFGDGAEPGLKAEGGATGAGVEAINGGSGPDFKGSLGALDVDTFAEPAAVPAATSTLAAKIGWLFTLARNKLTQTATTQTLRNDADGADIATAGVSDNGTTFTRNEWA